MDLDKFAHSFFFFEFNKSGKEKINESRISLRISHSLRNGQQNWFFQKSGNLHRNTIIFPLTSFIKWQWGMPLPAMVAEKLLLSML